MGRPTEEKEAQRCHDAFAMVTCILTVCFIKVDHKLFFCSCTIKLWFN